MNRQSEQTRRRILLAAAEAFSAHGFRGATIRQICTRAGANVAAVSYHFGSKENLYLETYRFVFQDKSPLASWRGPLRVTSAADWERELYNWAHALLDQISNPEQTHVWECRMFSRERCEPSLVLPLLLREFFLPIQERLMLLLLMALPAETPKHDVQMWVVSVIAQCTVFAQREPPWDEHLLPRDLPREQWLEQTARHIVGGVTSRLHYRT